MSPIPTALASLILISVFNTRLFLRLSKALCPGSAWAPFPHREIVVKLLPGRKACMECTLYDFPFLRVSTLCHIQCLKVIVSSVLPSVLVFYGKKEDLILTTQETLNYFIII